MQKLSILIDRGVAVMQPSFLASWDRKKRWVEKAEDRIAETSEGADAVVISHYYCDHFVDFDDELYEGELILAKNLNEYINDSQRARAKSFIQYS